MPRRGENIRKRKDGRWEGRYYTKEIETGKSILHSVYAKTYGEVKQKLFVAKLASETNAARAGRNTNVRFKTVAEEWLCHVCSEKKHATYIKYRSVYEKHIQHKVGEMFVSELDSKNLSRVFTGGSREMLSDSLQKSISCVLNQILSYAVSQYHCHPFTYSH